MNTASNRMKALVAGGAAFAAFGIGVMLPASATAPAPSPDGLVGQAWLKADPKGQENNEGKNRGFTCDGNGGVGIGNPAFGTCSGIIDDDDDTILPDTDT